MESPKFMCLCLHVATATPALLPPSFRSIENRALALLHRADSKASRVSLTAPEPSRFGHLLVFEAVIQLGE